MDEARLIRALKQQLMTDAMLGVEQVPWRAPRGGTPGGELAERLKADVPVSVPAPANAPAQNGGGFTSSPNAQASPTPTKQPPLPRPPAIELAGGTKQAKLAELKAHLLANESLLARCPAGTQLVFGEGDPDAKIMFVGEGPGQHEAEQGRPFVGPAGQLLEKMINAMGLKREDVYITNMVNFRPPNNRVPTPEEVVFCDAYLMGQIQTVRPGAIVCLGGTAAKNMLETNTGITRLRGNWVQYDRLDPPIDLMPTFHPAFLLRSYTKDNRAKVWSDLQAVMKKVGMAVE